MCPLANPPVGSSDTSGPGMSPVPGPFLLPTRKSRQGFPRRLLPLRWACLDGFLRPGISDADCAALPLGRTACMRLRCVASMSGPTIPDAQMLSLVITLIKQRCCPIEGHGR
jgi:hypothetical protein